MNPCPPSVSPSATRPAPTRVRAAVRCVLAVALLGTTGCAVRWTDPDTRVTHLWGIGHLAVAVDADPAPPQAVMVASSTLGLDFSRIGADWRLGLGYGRVEETRVAPDGAAFSVRIPRTTPLEFEVGHWNRNAGHDDHDDQQDEADRHGAKER